MGQESSKYCNYDCVLGEEEDWECSRTEGVANVTFDTIVILTPINEEHQQDFVSGHLAFIFKNHNDCLIQERDFADYDLRVYSDGKPSFNIPFSLENSRFRQPRYLPYNQPYFAMVPEGLCESYRIPVIEVAKDDDGMSSYPYLFSAPMDAVSLRWNNQPLDHFGNVCTNSNRCAWTIAQDCLEGVDAGVTIHSCTAILSRQLPSDDQSEITREINRKQRAKMRKDPRKNPQSNSSRDTTMHSLDTLIQFPVSVQLSDDEWRKELDTYWTAWYSHSSSAQKTFLNSRICEDVQDIDYELSRMVSLVTLTAFLALMALALVLLWQIHGLDNQRDVGRDLMRARADDEEIRHEASKQKVSIRNSFRRGLTDAKIKQAGLTARQCAVLTRELQVKKQRTEDTTIPFDRFKPKQD